MRLAWLTDLHLNFVKPPQLVEFLRQVANLDADVFVLTGDIGEARDVTEYLEKIDEAIQRPIYFVLGNHDFYFGSIAGVRRAVAELCDSRPRLRYLTRLGPMTLTEDYAIVGDDGWADARLGNYQYSYVMMNDYRLIEELAPYGKMERWPILKSLGDEAASHLREKLPLAFESHRHVFLATHVPPFREACWHEGQLSDDEWAPHFSCQATGEAILDTMRKFPERQLIVLCGHTHGFGEYQPLPNVRVLTGGAEYGRPGVCQVFDI